MFIKVNGDRQWMSCRGRPEEEILKWLSLLTLQAGDTEPIRYRKHWHTDAPSIQGPWTAFTHKNPAFNLADFPNNELSKQLNMEETATEKLLRIAQEYSETKDEKNQ